MLVPVEVWNGKLHRPHITAGKSIDFVAEELSNQLWYTVQPDQIWTQRGGRWDGRWDYDLKLRLAEPWFWIIGPSSERVEINPKFALHDFKEQLFRRGLDPDLFEFPQGKGTNQVIHPKMSQVPQPPPKKRQTKQTSAENPEKVKRAPVRRAQAKPKPSVVEPTPPKPKKRTILFTNDRKFEVADSEAVDEVAQRAGVVAPILLQDSKGSTQEDWWVALDTSHWFKEGQIEGEVIKCKVSGQVWVTPGSPNLSEPEIEELIRNRFEVKSDEVLITWPKSPSNEPIPRLKARISNYSPTLGRKILLPFGKLPEAFEFTGEDGLGRREEFHTKVGLQTAHVDILRDGLPVEVSSCVQ
jgi:hypothetical protein